MEYTKSEIREAKKRIDKELATIKNNVQYIHTDIGLDLMWWSVVGNALKTLHNELAPLKKHIIDTDNYSLAIEINDKITPVWNEYCTRTNKGDFETHKEAYPVQTIINDLREWIKEQEATQTKPTTEAFFKTFEALAHDCILNIGFKYRTRTEKPKLPVTIVQEFETYQNTKPDKETLRQEIESHLSRCKTPSEAEQYICSLLLPFKEICKVLRPMEQTEESRLFVELLCTSMINHHKEEAGTIEYCLRSMLNDMNDYSMRLYGILEKNCLDLNEYQQKTGVYLRREWNPADGMFFNIGDWDLIKSYESAHQTTPTSTQSGENGESKSNYITNIEVLNVLPSLYAFLVKKKVISESQISCTDYTTAIEKADISSIYPNSVKYKFKTTIKAIQKCFTEDWFKAMQIGRNQRG